MKTFFWLVRPLGPTICCVVLLIGAVSGSFLPSVSGDDTDTFVAQVEKDPRSVLSEREWSAMDKTIDSGLRYLITQQRDDGSFLAPPTGQPGVTSLAVLACLSGGHLPGEGPYGESIDKAI